jgi:uncharacterized protein YjbI with pentapeptide repeats
MHDKPGCQHFREREPVANDEHLATLRLGATIWNEWREGSSGEQPDLSWADLSGEDLSGADLSYADLSGADLSEADLYGSNLARAFLQPFLGQPGRQEDYRDTDLSRADLRNANLFQADLLLANLSGANLSGADLTGTQLNWAILRGTNLSGAKLSGADLSDARLYHTDLSRADLFKANLSEAILHEAEFTQSIFGNTILGDLDLSSARGLDHCVHRGPSTIDFSTLSRSEDLPLSFLRGCGLPDLVIDYLQSLRGDAIRFYSCFISYSAKDQVFADRLYADLQNKGVRCWFAPHDMPIGGKIWDAIDEAIRLRDKLLVILSNASIGSDWVEDEVNKAYAEERSRKRIVLFPIRIDNAVMSTAEPWAIKLRDQRNIGDFRQWKKPTEYQKSLERLLRDLKASAAK